MSEISLTEKAWLSKQLFADQLDNPVNANWAVNALAPASADPANAALTVCLFDDTAEEGKGLIYLIPQAATNITIKLVSRGITAPGAARTVGNKLYYRQIPDNAAVGAWNSIVLNDIDIPTNAFFQYDSQTIALSTFAPAIVANSVYQFELTRINPAAGTELVGDWALLSFSLNIS